MAIKVSNAKIAQHYDKIIGAVVLVGLVGSLLYLALHTGFIRRLDRQFSEKIARMRPEHPQATMADGALFEEAVRLVKTPFQLGSYSNAVFVPESRVWCVDCRQPIPYFARDCTFCDKVQPDPKAEPTDRDSDGDGMMDSWEKTHGLDLRDPTDGAVDRDGDGFTNREEHDASPSTDPNDASSYPSIIPTLCVEDIKANPFQLRFKSVSKLPDGGLKFALNFRGGGRTYFLKLGDDVQGFKVATFEPKTEMRERPGFPKPREVDVSVLTLRRGDKTIPLILRQDVQYNEYTATVVFPLDNAKFSVSIGQTIDIRNGKYKVTGVDGQQRTLTLVRVEDGQTFVIPHCSQ